MPSANPSQLLESQELQSLLQHFAQDWDEFRLAEHVSKLPPDGPFRRTALPELVKLDLRLHWHRGSKRTLDSYLLFYPELGTPETVAPELIRAELEARQQAGDMRAWQDLAQRFPQQCATIQRDLTQNLQSAAPDPYGPTLAPDTHPDPVLLTHRPESPKTPAMSHPNSSTGPLPPGQFEQRYKFIKELGRGAMGTVYLAQDTHLQRQVAIKRPHFRPGDNPDLLERFHREARSAANLDHPNICPVYDVGEHNGLPYLTMAFIEGPSLTEIIRCEQPLDQRRIAEVVYKLARALEEAHRCGIMHRDLKPANVLINRFGEPVLMDFGLARQIEQDTRLTQRGSVLGTPAYMSPEQVHGDPRVGPATDIYSLGVMLYELITGQVPFQGSLGQVMSGILTQTPRPPRQLRADADPKLEAICLKAMAKVPAERFGSMADFATTLASWLQLPAQTSPSSVPEIEVPEGLRPTQEEKQTQLNWRDVRAEPTDHSKLLVRGGIALAAVVAVAVVALLVSSLFRPESPEQFQARIQALSREGKFEEALQQIQDANGHDEQTRAAARKEVRGDVLKWAQQQIETRQAPGQVSERLTALQPHFPGDAALVTQLTEARRLDTQQEVERLSGKQQFKEALGKLGQFGFAEEWAQEAKKNLLQKWTTQAERLLDPDRQPQFRKALQEAQALLELEPDYPGAVQVRDEASARITEITKGVNQRLARKEFGDAADYLKRSWPGDEDRLHDKIFTQWCDLAKRQLQDNELKKAEETLAAVAKRYAQDPQKKTEIEAQQREVALARVRNPVNLALKTRTPEAFRIAARAVTGPEAAQLKASERTELQQKLEQEWLAQLRKEPAVGPRLAQLEDMATILKSAAAKREIAVIREGATIPTQTAAALQLPGVTRDDFTGASKTLRGLRVRAVEVKDQQRIDGLLELLGQGEKAASDPQGAALEALAASLANRADLLPEDRNALKKLQGRLFALRVERNIPTLADQGAWEKALQDCRQVGEDANTWVRASRVECLAELRLAAKEVNEAEWQQALTALLEQTPSPQAAPYALYARALAGSLGDRPREEAPRVIEVFGKPAVAPELQALHRKQRAAMILSAAAESFRRERGTFAEPFGAKEDADTAFGWLDLAARLAGPKADERLKRNLVLAAWHKTKADVELAGRLVPEVVRKESLEQLPTPEAFRFTLIHARTRGPALAERKAAAASYLTALKQVEVLLRAPGADKDFTLQVVRPVCEAFHAAVIKPLTDKQGRDDLLSPKPDQDLKSQVARLAAASGGLIKSELPRWQELTPLGPKALEKVVDLYEVAFQQASEPVEKAEYVVLKAYAYQALPHPSLAKALAQLKADADTATRTAPEYAGGYGLKGVVAIYQSRLQGNWKDKLPLLQEADTELQRALKGAAKLEKDKARELSLLLYHSLGAACLELGNYSGELAQRKQYLFRGKDYVEQLLKLEGKNREGLHTYGLLLEDVGYYVEEPEKNYDLACQALQKVMDPQNLLAGETRPWLAHGRVQVKWAERLKGQARDKLLAAAADDLQQVVKWSRGPLETAEAHYWRGRLHTLRGNARLAGQAYADGLAAADKPGCEMWREPLLREGATWALLQVGAGFSGKGDANLGEIKSHLALAEKRARQLETFSRANAGWLLLAAVRWQARVNKDKADAEALEKVFARALGEKWEDVRLQDHVWRVRLLCERGRMYLAGGELPRDLTKAYADGVAAVELTRQSSAIWPDDKVAALGLAAEAAFDLLVPKEQFAEPIQRLREVLALAPKHESASKWKASLAAALYLNDSKDAKNLREAARLITEAEQQLPRNATEGLKNFIQGWKKAIQEKTGSDVSGSGGAQGPRGAALALAPRGTPDYAFSGNREEAWHALVRFASESGEW